MRDSPTAMPAQKQLIVPELDALTAAVRSAVSLPNYWTGTAHAVAGELRSHSPSPDILGAEQRTGDPANYRDHLLRAETDGSFSIIAVVWIPGQVTPVHDHITWCVSGVIQGLVYEEPAGCVHEYRSAVRRGSALTSATIWR